MTDAEIARYSEALHAEAPHAANAGVPPPGAPGYAPPPPPGYPPQGYANQLLPGGGLLQTARPLLLPAIVAGSVWHLSKNAWWTAGLGIATLLLQGNTQPPPPPANPYAAYAPR